MSTPSPKFVSVSPDSSSELDVSVTSRSTAGVSIDKSIDKSIDNNDDDRLDKSVDRSRDEDINGKSYRVNDDQEYDDEGVRRPSRRLSCTAKLYCCSTTANHTLATLNVR